MRFGGILGAAVVGAFLAMGSAAHANTVNLGTIDGSEQVQGNILTTGVSFADYYTFDVSSTVASVDATVFNFNLPESIRKQILNLQVILFQGSVGSGTELEASGIGTGAGSESLTLPTGYVTEANNPYYFEVTGTVPTVDPRDNHTVVGGQYDLNIYVTSVPEPATWAMMMLGVAFIGFKMRSRARATVEA